MIEQTREIARRFNHLYGETLTMPEALLSDVPRLPGTDGGEKMSKSLDNTIDLSDSADAVRQKVMRMYTDPSRIHRTDPGHVQTNPVFRFHEVFNPDRHEVAELKDRYGRGAVGDVEVKRRLVEVLNDLLDPIRRRRAEYARDLGAVEAMLKRGTLRGRAVAAETLRKVRRALRIEYFEEGSRRPARSAGTPSPGRAA